MHRVATSDKTNRAERRRLEEKAKIIGLLTVKKLTLASIDEEYELPAGTASNALNEPHLAGERAVAAALRTRPELLWRTRYHSNGIRFAPQPVMNYRHARRRAALEAA